MTGYLNNDTDMTDVVVRWVRMVTPILPENAAVDIKALFEVPGGTHGLSEHDNRLVIVADELTGGDIDTNNGLDSHLVGVLLPTTSNSTAPSPTPAPSRARPPSPPAATSSSPWPGAAEPTARRRPAR